MRFKTNDEEQDSDTFAREKFGIIFGKNKNISFFLLGGEIEFVTISEQ
jgi:hypothetical protein